MWLWWWPWLCCQEKVMERFQLHLRIHALCLLLRPGIRYNSVCYYLLKGERTWDEAQNQCSKLGASLAVLSDKEMDHLLSPSQDHVFRLNGNLDYWLGLRRRGERFQWVDGSSYNSSLEVLGNSECVYLADHKLRSEDCSTERAYLCSKPQPHLY
ncbi:early activation antigen CD69-like isoform X2 [Pipra filicauda]|uniref:Early activation antigen CD69-like isoform X2 n=1 Tax=Pipra filicauda TaxID=649802 RepID=A0A7R5L797_9PASS|nr:early activation antigen CD69-like isoform X2 [Pipra filicauda]